jgi:hypothetical protein
MVVKVFQVESSKATLTTKFSMNMNAIYQIEYSKGSCKIYQSLFLNKPKEVEKHQIYISKWKGFSFAFRKGEIILSKVTSKENLNDLRSIKNEWDFV